MLASYGLPALRFLSTRDPEERALLTALAQRADALAFDREKRLATHIANAFVKARLHG